MFVCLIALLIVVCGVIDGNTNPATPPIGVDDLNGIDAIGAFSNVIDTVLTQMTLGNSPPKESLCSTRLIKYTDNEAKVSGQPRGTCSYCCPIIHPKKYVKLFFTNKSKGRNMVELKLVNKSGSLQAAGVRSNIQTIIFVHGFTEHGLGPLPIKIRDAYLSRPEDRNIILVDWGELSSLPWYPHAVQNTRIVAKLLANFIAYYSYTGELPISQLHLVGFSLGAHIVGFIGKALQNKEKVPRITALDPARPLFSLEDSTQRVSKDDAEYVDVIHTDGGKFGISVSIGHSDFYPNGGVYVQPGCTFSSLAENRTIEHFGMCSHLRAVDFYSESVWNPRAFPVYKCSSRCKRQRSAYMGFLSTKESAPGDFYLVTNSRAPFGRVFRN